MSEAEIETALRNRLADQLEKTTAALEAAVARADRSEAEFCACKALLIAEQKRAERAEAERAEAEEHENSWAINATDFVAIQNGRVAAAEQKASEARALALEEAAVKALSFCPVNTTNHRCYPVEIAEAIRALAALPVEPARRQEDVEVTRAGGLAVTDDDLKTARLTGAPAARSPEEGT